MLSQAVYFFIGIIFYTYSIGRDNVGGLDRYDLLQIGQRQLYLMADFACGEEDSLMILC